MRSALAAVAVTAVLYGAFATLQLRRAGGDVSSFVVAGEEFSHPDGVKVEQSAGYDGQFYLRLALRPLSTAPVEHGIRLDYPVYRAQRIIYPLIVNTLSFGSMRATLWLLLLVNLAAVCAVSGLGALLLEHFGVAGAYGIVVSLFPSLLLTVRRDLTEAVELAFVLAGLLAIVKQRWLLAALLLAIAALSKEPSLLVPVKLSWLGYALLVTTLGPLFWDDDWSFLRPATELGVLGALIAMTSGAVIRRITATLISGWWLFLACDLLVYR